MFQRFNPDDWFEISAEDREYLSDLLLADMGVYDYGTDEYHRALRMNVALISKDT